MAALGGGGLTNPLLALVGYAVGTGAGPLLRPGVQDLINFAWSEHPVRPLPAEIAASMWLKGIWTPERAKQEGLYTGVGDNRMTALRLNLDDPPDLAVMLELWRRGLVSDGEFTTALQHLRIASDWYGAVRAIKNVLLTPEMLAEARQRGFVDQARQYSESELQGVTNDRAEIMFRSAGLPPPTERALQMWRRGILTEAEFKTTIVEGNEKLKYQDEEAALFHPLLTPGQIVNQRLRGWRDTAWMDARLAEHGFSAEQANDMFQGQGRPISFHQVFIGLRRGGVYNGPTGAIDPHFLKSLQESNIRPEWYNLAWAQRHSLPSAFVLRALTQAGDVTQADAERLLLWMGWPSDLAAKVSAAWAGGTGAAGVGPEVKSAHTRALTLLRNAYVARRVDDAFATDRLTALGIDAAVQGPLLDAWRIMQTIPGAGLTRAQVKKAFKSLPAEWPRDRALTELEDLGMEPEEAQTYLDE